MPIGSYCQPPTVQLCLLLHNSDLLLLNAAAAAAAAAAALPAAADRASPARCLHAPPAHTSLAAHAPLADGPPPVLYSSLHALLRCSVPL